MPIGAKGRIEISRKDASESDVEDEMDKDLAEILNGFDVLVRKGCACCLHVLFCPLDFAIIYNDSCPIHNEQWRREYLRLPAELYH